MRLFVVALILSLMACHSPETSSKEFQRYSKKSLLQDLDYLDQSLKRNHPGLYWYSAEKDFINLKKRLRASIKDSMSEPEYLKLISEYNSVIHCVHTDIKPSEKFKAYLDTAKCYLPFNVIKVNEDYHVYQNVKYELFSEKYPKIKSINGRPIAEIVDEIVLRIPADGLNETRKYNLLQRQFNKYVAWFVFPGVTHYTVEVIDMQNKTRSLKIEGLEKNWYRAKWNAEYKHTGEHPVFFSLLKNDNIGVLTIRSFRNDLMEKFEIDFRHYLSEAFDSLQKTHSKKLIVDLRGNGGGYSEYGAQLIAFLSDTSFQYCQKMVLNSSELDSRLKYDIPETFAEFPKGIVCPYNECLWTKHSVLGWRKPEQNGFKGKVVFLIDGGCVSTTSEVATVAHRLQLGSFVGEEVGGSYQGDSGGVLGFATLPNTGIQVRIAMVKYVLSEDDEFDGHGVIPKHVVHHSIEGLNQNGDETLEKAIQLIR